MTKSKEGVHPADQSAGMTFAPEYDKSSEIDPSAVEAVNVVSANLEKLEYFQAQQARKTLVARTVLVVLIFGMLSANMWLTSRNYDHMLINLDQARSAQAKLEETTWRHLKGLDDRLAVIESSLATTDDEAAATQDDKGDPASQDAGGSE